VTFRAQEALQSHPHRPYQGDMNAAFMSLELLSLELHERGIHVV
jgi:hypothetical protein